jgi:glycopeptide antibiotics resistance protein
MKLVFWLFMFISVHAAIFFGGTARVNGYGLSGYPIHFIAFFCVAGVSSMLLLNRRLPLPFLFSIAYTSILVFVLEGVQSLIPHRTFSITDIYWGVAGALAYSIIAKIFFRTERGNKIKKLMT